MFSECVLLPLLVGEHLPGSNLFQTNFNNIPIFEPNLRTPAHPDTRGPVRVR